MFCKYHFLGQVLTWSCRYLILICFDMGFLFYHALETGSASGFIYHNVYIVRPPPTTSVDLVYIRLNKSYPKPQNNVRRGS